MLCDVKKYKNLNKDKHAKFILGGDIGGTNTRVGIFGIGHGSGRSRPSLLISFNFQSRKLHSLSDAINTALNYAWKDSRVEIKAASIAAAGPLSKNKSRVQITNLELNIDKRAILDTTKLNKVILLNDFEAVGYGVNMLNKRDIKAVKQGQKIPNAPIVVLGAGTGLGKTTLIYDTHSKSYNPIPSEAGHSDFPAQDKDEFELVSYMKKREKLGFVSFEHFLSGHGLTYIYSYLRKERIFKESPYTKTIDKLNQKPEAISKYRNVDKTCKATFEIFKKFYSRFAKNCALDSLAYGGVYITGRIAVCNKDIFDLKFAKYFEQNYKLAYILKKIPIYLILNNNVGLLGAAFAYCKKSLELSQNE